MKSHRFNPQFLCQFVGALCGINDLLERSYIIDGLLDIVEAFRVVGEGLPQISILFDPVSQGPGEMTERPVSFDPLSFSDLVLIHHEEVLQFSVAVLDAPPESIEIDNSLSRKTRIVCDQNMDFLLVFLSVRAEKNQNFQWNMAVLEFALELVGHNRLGFAIQGFEPYRLYFVPVVFFDEGNELVLLHGAAFSFDWMVDQDVSVGLGLTDEGEIFRVQRFDEIGRMGIPGVEDDRREADFLCYSVIDEFLSELDLASEVVKGLFVEFLLFLIESEIDGKTLGFGNKSRGNEDVAHGLVAKHSAMLISGSFCLFGIDFWTGGIIDGKNSVPCGSCSPLPLDEGNPLIVELVMIPFGIREKILKVFVLAQSHLCNDFHVRSLHVPEQKVDVKAEVEELAPREEARKPGEKFVDENVVEPQTTHILCSSYGGRGFSESPIIHGVKVFFYRGNKRKASNERKLWISRLTSMDFFETAIF